MRGKFFPDISKSLLNPWEDLNKCTAFETLAAFARSSFR